jgi:DNA modification methylase
VSAPQSRVLALYSHDAAIALRAQAQKRAARTLKSGAIHLPVQVGSAGDTLLDRRVDVWNRRGKHRPILNDDLGGGFETFLYDACVNIVSVTKGAIYVCMSSSELHTLQRAFTAAGGKWSTFVIWAKNTFTLGRADYQRQYEPILYGWKDGSDHYWCGARPGRRLVLRQAGAQRPASDHEAGSPGRAGDPKLQQESGHRPGPLRRVRVDFDRV